MKLINTNINPQAYSQTCVIKGSVDHLGKKEILVVPNLVLGALHNESYAVSIYFAQSYTLHVCILSVKYDLNHVYATGGPSVRAA